MKFYFLTLFPDIISAYFSASIMSRAVRKSLVSFECINIRDFALDTHKRVDDRPYGGGPGMVMRADVLERALIFCFDKECLDRTHYLRSEYRVVVTSASGQAYTQFTASSLTALRGVFLICGHYEGIDQRFIDIYADMVVRVGDFVMTGGELPALAIADSCIRLLPGVLGNRASLSEESFTLEHHTGFRLEYPQYTRPHIFHGRTVPDVLLSGDHAAIAQWRLERSIALSYHQRLDFEKSVD